MIHENIPGCVWLPLTREKFALIDEEDLERVSAYRWRFDRYAVTGGNKHEHGPRKMYLHRFLMDDPWGKWVDHINGDPLDNRKSNLRLSEISENCQNRRPNVGRSSKYKGVHWCNTRQRWMARAGETYLGVFKDEIEAARRYDKSAEAQYGHFAWLNRNHFQEVQEEKTEQIVETVNRA